MSIPSGPEDIIARIRASKDKAMWCDQMTARTLIATGQCRAIDNDNHGRVLVGANK